MLTVSVERRMIVKIKRVWILWLSCLCILFLSGCIWFLFMLYFFNIFYSYQS